MSTKPTYRRSIFMAVLWSSLSAAASAHEPMAAGILPTGTVVYAEIRAPHELINSVYDHKLVARFLELRQVQAAMEKKEYLDFKAAIALIESQLGLPWRKIVHQVAGGGIAFAVDAETKGLAILVRATDADTLTKLVETLANLASLDAKSNGKPDPVKVSNYREAKTYEVGKGKLAVVTNWLIVTNQDNLGESIVDNLLVKPANSLVLNAPFARAHATASETSTGWAFVDVAALREAGLAKKLFDSQSDNPLAELIFGGILSTLRNTPYVTASLELDDTQVRVMLSTPHNRGWAGDLREYYFGPRGAGAAPIRIAVDDAILNLCTYRDVSAMWLRAGDLLDARSNEGLAKADSNLSTLFAGKDFGEDILGALQPELQLVVARQTFANDQPSPAIKLPAFGIIAELRDATTMQPELRRTFQSLIGFLNVLGAMNGQPQLDLDMEKADELQLVTSEYVPGPVAGDRQGLRINYNFSPSIAFAGSRFVVASTKSLARALATANVTSRSSDDAGPVVNTDAILDFGSLRNALADNRGQLVAQNMLKEGHTKDEAERDIGTLLAVVEWFDLLALRLETTSSELNVTLDLGIKSPN